MVEKVGKTDRYGDFCVQYVDVELHLGFTEGAAGQVFTNFTLGRFYVESKCVSRFRNPALVAFSDIYELMSVIRGDIGVYSSDEGNAVREGGIPPEEWFAGEGKPDKYIDLRDRVVAIPMRDGLPVEAGYGYKYADYIEDNRDIWIEEPIDLQARKEKADEHNKKIEAFVKWTREQDPVFKKFKELIEDMRKGGDT